jgi:hypothetical protein
MLSHWVISNSEPMPNTMTHTSKQKASTNHNADFSPVFPTHNAYAKITRQIRMLAK